jgi:lipoate-protein ligase A
VIRPDALHLFDRLRVLNDHDFRRAAENMAIDEALLEQATLPTLRFYRWDHRALSFGYFGKVSEVAQFAGDHDIVRRWTGGGIVFHGDDLTYAMVIPVATGSPAPSPRHLYRLVHRALCNALKDSGHGAELAEADSLLDSAACFERPVHADVMLANRKIAGAAQRRTRRGLLQQGSIQNVDLAEGFADDFAARLGRQCEPQAFSKNLIARAVEIAQSKYASPAWLSRR